MGDWITETPQGVIQTLATVPMQTPAGKSQATYDCVKERILEELKEGKEVTIKITRKNKKRKRTV